MGRDLATRQDLVLRIIVQEYIAKALPVGSETLARSYNLGVSPATVRNCMARLEEEGYIAKPHTSAGSVPLTKAYRYYVETLARNVQLTPAEHRSIQRTFRETEMSSEDWIRLAAALLARLVRNTALVTWPKARRARLKHLQLVSVNDHVVLLVVVLHDMKLRQQLLQFSEPLDQEQLTAMAIKLNAALSLLSGKEIVAKALTLTRPEAHIVDVVLDIITAEDGLGADRPYFEGLRLMLDQPEFLPGDRMLNVMGLVENMDWLHTILSRDPGESGVQVVIGDESANESLRDLSLVFSRYGIPDDIGGAIGVLGPIRMDYARSIATVHCLAGILSNLLEGLYGSPAGKGEKGA